MHNFEWDKAVRIDKVKLFLHKTRIIKHKYQNIASTSPVYILRVIHTIIELNERLQSSSNLTAKKIFIGQGHGRIFPKNLKIEINL